MASTTWRIYGLATNAGGPLVLSGLRAVDKTGDVSAGGTITSSVAPASGSLANLLDGDAGTACEFSAADIAQPGFWIQFELAAAKDVWGFTFASPTRDAAPAAYTLVQADAKPYPAAEFKRIVFLGAGVYTASPKKAPPFFQENGVWKDTGMNAYEASSVCISEDGQIIFETRQYTSGGPVISRNGGLTSSDVTALQGKGNGRAAGMSADGSVIIQAGFPSAYLQLSVDAGISWTAMTALGARSWYAAAVSADGQVLLAGTADNTSLWWSTDAGVSWSSGFSGRNWAGCAIGGAYGQYLLASGSGSVGAVLSTDFGATWSAVGPTGTRNWGRCAISGDGQTIILLEDSHPGHISRNGGATFGTLPVAALPSLSSCAVSADGATMLLGRAGSKGLLMSLDGGYTWAAQVEQANRQPRGVFVTRESGICAVTSVDQTVSVLSLPDSIYVKPEVLSKTEPLAVPAVAAAEPGAVDMRQGAMLVVGRDIEHGGLGTIYGTTKTKGTPNQPTHARVVLLHQRSKLPVRETWSDPVTGNFAFTGIDTAQQFITLAEDAAGNFRPVAANRLTPEVLP